MREKKRLFDDPFRRHYREPPAQPSLPSPSPLNWISLIFAAAVLVIAIGLFLAEFA